MSSPSAKSPPLSQADMEADYHNGMLAAYIVFIVSDTLLFVIRIFARRTKTSAKWGWDDAFMIPAYILNIGFCVSGIASAYYAHIGQHTEAMVALLGSTTLVPFLESAWAFGPLWLLSSALPKLSILSLYLRLFSPRWVKVCCISLMIFISINAIACIIASCVMCQPLDSWWNKQVPGHCFDTAAFFVAVNVPHISSDICLLLLPIPILLKLNMSLIKTLGTIFTFLLGGMGFSASVYRLWLFASSHSDPNGDELWGPVTDYSWSIIESNLYFTIACVLALPPLIGSIANTGLCQRLVAIMERISLYSGDAWSRKSSASAADHAKSHPRTTEKELHRAWYPGQRSGSTFEIIIEYAGPETQTQSDDEMSMAVQRGKSIGVTTEVTVAR